MDDEMANACLVDIREPLDPILVEKTLNTPPFLQIDGLINVRSIPLPEYSSPSVQRGIILRSGETEFTSESGKEKLLSLGITKVFDLRSPREGPAATTGAFTVPGIDVLCVPVRAVSRSNDLGATFALFQKGGDEPFLESYREVLEEGVEPIRAVFEFVRDKVPLGEGCLIHCTAGKDRTGVVVMLILDIAGVDDDTIVKDYCITRIGLESGRESSLSRFQKLWDNPAIVTGVVNAFSSRPTVMVRSLKMLRDEFGGAEAYLKDRAGFTTDDIRLIKHALLGPPHQASL